MADAVGAVVGATSPGAVTTGPQPPSPERRSNSNSNSSSNCSSGLSAHADDHPLLQDVSLAINVAAVGGADASVAAEAVAAAAAAAAAAPPAPATQAAAAPPAPATQPAPAPAPAPASGQQPHLHRATTALLCGMVILGYGLSMYMNGSSSKTLHLSPVLTVHLMGVGRGAALAVICVLLWLHGRGWRLKAAVEAAGTASAQPITWHVLIPPLVAFCGNAAFLPLSVLLSGQGQLSILSPLTGLSAAIPVTVGLCCRGEPRTLSKLVGIATSLLATLLLAFSDPALHISGGTTTSSSTPAATPAGIARDAALFLLTVGMWGLCDTVSSVVGRRVSTLHVAMGSFVGQLMTAAVFGCAALAQADTGADSLTNIIQWRWQHAALLGANALAICGWLAFVALGRRGGAASAIVPVTSLYVYVPVLLGVLVLHEKLPPLRIAGLLAAAVAVVLIASPFPSPSPAAAQPAAKPAASAASAEGAEVTGKAGGQGGRESTLSVPVTGRAKEASTEAPQAVCV